MNAAELSRHIPMHGAVLTCNKKWEITAVNRQAEELLGRGAEELVGRSVNEFFGSEQNHADLAPFIEPVSRGEICTNHPILIRTNDDRAPRIAAVTILPLPGKGMQADGAVLCLLHTAKSANIMQDAINCMRDGVFTTDTSLHITSFNRAAEKITGLDREEAIGSPCRKILQCSTCQDYCAPRQSMASGDPIQDHKVTILANRSAAVPVHLNTAPLRDEYGQISGCIGSFYDTTSMLRAALILDSVADGVFTVDREWKITSFNRAAEVITGMEAGDAIGRSCSEIFQSNLCGRDCAIARSLYTGHSVTNRSITIRNRRGEPIPISISASPLADDQGNIIGGVETFRDLTAITALRHKLTGTYHLGGIVSRNKTMQSIFSILPEIAASHSPVLIHGESGTGKGILARALYEKSDRNHKPFITVNCGAMPESLLESGLFAAGTGGKKKGRVAAAEGGTLYLTEIEVIPLSLQHKLQRFLEKSVYEPPGSDNQVRGDVRIIASTRKDLGKMVVNGTFREDLFYQLNVVRLKLPPLRERKEDIPPLIRHFISEFSAETGKDIVGMANPALTILMRHDFPGNIRELRNIIEYAFILCDGALILPEHLPDPFDRKLEPDPD